MRSFFCLAISFLLSGCSLLNTTPGKGPDGNLRMEMLLKEQQDTRFNEIEALGELRVVVYPSGPPVAYILDGKLCGSEKEKIELLSMLSGWRVTFSVCSRREAAAFVRNGKADLAAGGFTLENAKELNLTEVLPHHTGGRNCVFLTAPYAGKLRQKLQSLEK